MVPAVKPMVDEPTTKLLTNNDHRYCHCVAMVVVVIGSMVTELKKN